MREEGTQQKRARMNLTEPPAETEPINVTANFNRTSSMEEGKGEDAEAINALHLDMQSWPHLPEDRKFYNHHLTES